MDQEDPSGAMVYIAVPQMLQEEIKDMVRMATEIPTFRDGEEFTADEREVYRRSNRIGNKVMGYRLQALADLDEIRDAVHRLAKGQSRTVKDQGLRDVHIMTMRGGEITIRTPYFSRNCDVRRSRGTYPVLGLLGIYGRRRYYTPALAHHVVLLTTAMGSIDEARKWLSELG